jgi:hypothetical protein
MLTQYSMSAHANAAKIVVPKSKEETPKKSPIANSVACISQLRI